MALFQLLGKQLCTIEQFSTCAKGTLSILSASFNKRADIPGIPEDLKVSIFSISFTISSIGITEREKESGGIWVGLYSGGSTTGSASDKFCSTFAKKAFTSSAVSCESI